MAPSEGGGGWFGHSAEGPAGGEPAGSQGRLQRGCLRCADVGSFLTRTGSCQKPESSRRIRASEIEGEEASEETADVFK